jgi:O-antigen/teichoic acid export membrane protein
MRAVVSTFLARAYTGVVTLAVGVAVARWMGPSPRGAYETLSYLRLGVQHASLLAVANTYFVSRDPSRLPRAAGGSLAVAGVLGGVLALAFLGAKAAVPGWLAPATFLECAPFFAAAPAIVAGHLLSGALLGAGRLWAWNGAIVANRTAVLAALAAAAAVPALRSLGFVLATLAAAEALGAAVAWRGARRPGDPPLAVDRALLRSMARYGAVASLHVLLAFGLVRADAFLLERLRGADEVGQWAAASLLREPVLFVPWVVSLLVLPRVAGDPGDRGRHARALGVPAVGLAAAVGAVLWAAAPEIVVGVHGEAFAPAVGLARVLVPGGLLLGTSHLLFQDLLGRGAPRAVLWIPGLGVVALVVLDLLVVPAHGALGAAWVSTGVGALQCAAGFAAFRRHVRAAHPPGRSRAT